MNIHRNIYMLIHFKEENHNLNQYNLGMDHPPPKFTFATKSQKAAE